MAGTRDVERARRQGRPSRGDVTGREKAAAERTQTLTVKQRNIDNINKVAEASAVDTSGVFDPQTGEMIEDLSGNDLTLIDDEFELDDPEVTAPAGFATSLPGLLGDEQIFTGQEAPESLPPRETGPAPIPIPRHVLPNAMAVIRVAYDIENMTYGIRDGVPNNYNFQEGRAYKVPYDVAEHLHNIGMVSQWIR